MEQSGVKPLFVVVRRLGKETVLLRESGYASQVWIRTVLRLAKPCFACGKLILEGPAFKPSGQPTRRDRRLCLACIAAFLPE